MGYSPERLVTQGPYPVSSPRIPLRKLRQKQKKGPAQSQQQRCHAREDPGDNASGSEGKLAGVLLLVLERSQNVDRCGA